MVFVYFIRKKQPPLPPKPNKFFLEHKKPIRKLTDIFLICILLFNLLLFMGTAIPILIKNMFYRPSVPEIPAVYLQTSWLILLMPSICISGWSGMLIGLLSIFQSNLTRTKRVILLIVCFLPVVLTVLALLTEYSEDYGLIELGLLSSLGCWLVNGPAVLVGKPFFQTSRNSSM